LSEEEIEKMVKDAEANAEEDRKQRELVDARNQADGLIHATRKSYDELGDKITGDEKAPIDAAIVSLEEALKTDDKDEIEAKSRCISG